MSQTIKAQLPGLHLPGRGPQPQTLKSPEQVENNLGTGPNAVEMASDPEAVHQTLQKLLAKCLGKILLVSRHQVSLSVLLMFLLRTIEFPIRREGVLVKRKWMCCGSWERHFQCCYQSVSDVLKPREIEPGCRVKSRSPKEHPTGWPTWRLMETGRGKAGKEMESPHRSKPQAVQGGEP